MNHQMNIPKLTRQKPFIGQVHPMKSMQNMLMRVVIYFTGGGRPQTRVDVIEKKNSLEFEDMLEPSQDQLLFIPQLKARDLIPASHIQTACSTHCQSGTQTRTTAFTLVWTSTKLSV
jgi:hypothetical protein